jgi:phosphatidylglycerol---prolipoprotein diacylglyceryl transferase
MLTLFRDLFSPPRHMILWVIAAWIGLSLTERRAERHGITRDQINNLTFLSLTAFIIGGRVSYVLQNISAFIKSPLSIISINPDIFDLLGAVTVAVIIAVIYSQRQKISMWDCLDALTPFFAILAIGIGLSHLAAGTAFGKETNLPWGIFLWNANRHPTQIYETLAALATFCLLWFKKQEPRAGILFLSFCALTAGSQLFIQGFRGDSIYIFNGIRQAQITAWICLAIIFILLEIQLKKKSRMPQA